MAGTQGGAGNDTLDGGAGDDTIFLCIDVRALHVPSTASRRAEGRTARDFELWVGRDRSQARPIRIAPPFPATGTYRERLRGAETGQAVEGVRVQPAVAPARRPQTQASPRGSGFAAGFPAASLFCVSVRSQSRKARASGLSAEPGATARK